MAFTKEMATAKDNTKEGNTLLLSPLAGRALVVVVVGGGGGSDVRARQ